MRAHLEAETPESPLMPLNRNSEDRIMVLEYVLEMALYHESLR